MATVSSINGSNVYDVINNPLYSSNQSTSPLTLNSTETTLNNVASALNTTQEIASYNTFGDNAALAQTLLNTEYSNTSLESLAASFATLQSANLQNLFQNNPGLAGMLLNPVSINSFENMGTNLATIQGLEANGVTSQVLNIAQDFTASENSGAGLEALGAAYNALQSANTSQLIQNSALEAQAITGTVSENTTGSSTSVSTGNSLEALGSWFNILQNIPGTGLVQNNQQLIQSLFSNLTSPPTVGSIVNTSA